MRHRGFSAWGIQTGPFAVCKANFVLKCFQPFTLPPMRNPKCQFLLPQRERLKMRKGIHQNYLIITALKMAKFMQFSRHFC